MPRAVLALSSALLLALACATPSTQSQAQSARPMMKNGVMMSSDTSVKKGAKVVCAMEHDTGSNIPVQVCRRVEDPDTEGALRVQDSMRIRESGTKGN